MGRLERVAREEFADEVFIEVCFELNLSGAAGTAQGISILSGAGCGREELLSSIKKGSWSGYAQVKAEVPQQTEGLVAEVPP